MQDAKFIFQTFEKSFLYQISGLDPDQDALWRKH